MKYRDLTIIAISSEQDIVIACDSCAGAGEKENDVILAPPRLVGGLATRVPLMEMLCYSAKPKIITQLLGNEMHPTGEQTIAGMKDELAKAGYSDIEINGSTEENMSPTVTSLGITLIGMAHPSIKQPLIKAGDKIYLVGTPLIGEDVITQFSELVTYDEVKLMRNKAYIKDILPIGSKGSVYEAKEMANTNDLEVKLNIEWLNNKLSTASGGPATSVLVAVETGNEEAFEKILKGRIQQIGEFVNK